MFQGAVISVTVPLFMQLTYRRYRKCNSIRPMNKGLIPKIRLQPVEVGFVKVSVVKKIVSLYNLEVFSLRIREEKYESK